MIIVALFVFRGDARRGLVPCPNLFEVQSCNTIYIYISYLPVTAFGVLFRGNE